MSHKTAPTLLLVLAFAFAGCSPAAVTTPTAVPTATLVPATATVLPTPEPKPYPQTYTDALDRSVTISAKPVRIVSLAPSVTEILFAIGARPQVVGRTKFCNYPPEVTSLPEIGGFSAKSISLEAILALEPDLVVAGTASQKDVVATLESQGITVFTLAPKSLADIELGIQMLGEITGNVEGAAAVVSDMQTRIEAVKEKINTMPGEKRLRVFYEVANEPLMTTTHSTFIGELLELAGAVNVFNDLDGTYPEVSAEQIVKLDPQVILGPSTHSDQLTIDALSTRPGWQDVSAVKNNAIYIVDSDVISRAGPRVAEALETIAKLLYPDVFGQ
jgi:iron complex transport system substrate-binding protein